MADVVSDIAYQRGRIAGLIEAANLDFAISRGEVIASRYECHKRQCSCTQPSNDVLVKMIAHCFRDAIQERTLMAQFPDLIDGGADQ